MFVVLEYLSPTHPPPKIHGVYGHTLLVWLPATKHEISVCFTFLGRSVLTGVERNTVTPVRLVILVSVQFSG